MNLSKLRLTPDERDTIDWCCSNLEPEDISEIEAEARDIAAVEINAPVAAETLLLSTWVRILVRNAKVNGVEL